MQPNLTAQEIKLLKQINESERGECLVRDGKPPPVGADHLVELGYVKVHPLNVQDLVYSITPTGRAALAAIDPEAYG